MARARRHHLISQGYQRFWSADGRRIVQVSKHDRVCRLIGIRDAFLVPNLLTVNAEEGPSHAAEEAFGSVESAVLPDVRRYIEGADDAAARRGVVVLAAMHWARGGATTSLLRTIVTSTVDETVQRSEADQEFARVFERVYGRPPDAGERSALTQQYTNEFVKFNGFFVERILEAHNRALDRWGSLHVQRVTLLRESGPRFLFADAPVVVTDRLRGTADKPIALGDASSVYFPLSPATAVFLTTKSLPAESVAPWQVQVLNQRTLRWASRFLGAHPDTDLDRALAAKRGTYTRHR